MKRLAIIACFISICCVLPASADQTTEPREVLIFEPMKVQCLDFIGLERDPLRADGAFDMRLGDIEDIKRVAEMRHWLGWLQGFMTAANMYDVNSSGTLGENTDATGWIPWLVDWCHANPGQKVTSGVLELRKLLGTK